jgi:hypothetical protein
MNDQKFTSYRNKEGGKEEKKLILTFRMDTLSNWLFRLGAPLKKNLIGDLGECPF